MRVFVVIRMGLTVQILGAREAFQILTIIKKVLIMSKKENPGIIIGDLFGRQCEIGWGYNAKNDSFILND